MNRTHVKLLALAVPAVAAVGVVGTIAVVSRAAPPKERLSAAQLSALAAAPPVSPGEAATVRDPRRGRPTEPAADSAITAHARAAVAGEAWKIVSYRAKGGALCAGVTWPGEGQEMGCATEEEWFAHGPVSVSVGARQAHGHPLTWQNVVLSGLVDLNRVQKLELVSTDCSTRDIAIDSSGFFLDVTTPALIARSVWPYQLRGEDGAGRVVQTSDVEPERPDTAEASAAGIRAPAVRSACA
jgi:hypothetical protein